MTAQLGQGQVAVLPIFMTKYRPILLASVQLSIKSILLDHYFYHWPVKAIIFVQVRVVVGESELELGTQSVS